jgi:peptidyl-prolyl cis-trans isomerase B (cyclophilin B)
MTTRSLLAAALALAVVATSAHAQLTPDRTYYGVDRPIPMTVKKPDGKAGEVAIKLLEAGTAKEVGSAAAAEGPVNLASLFPDLWQKKSSNVVYAQLVIGDEKIGPAVVIQPLADRGMATASPTGAAVFRPTHSAYSGIRAYVERNIVWDTSEGEIEFQLRPDQAPNTCWNFMQLAGGGFYTDIIFHRIINKLPQNGKRFVVQVGDPTGTGGGGPGYSIDLEASRLPHDFGVLSMARTGDPNTNGSQVFVCLSREGTNFLDNQYTAFGQAVRGADVIDKIAKSPTSGAEDRPVNPPLLKSAKLVDAPPYGTGAKPVTAPEAEPANGR